MKPLFHTPKGVQDILKEDQKLHDFIVEHSKKLAKQFNFESITLPIFEDAKIYEKGTGLNTDVVQKEMYEVKRYSNTDKEDDEKSKLALRPEFTPGVARAYTEHGMHIKSQPVKIFTYGPLFRHDKPQKGRFRQFNQINYEIIGNAEPITDATMILIVWELYNAIGLKDSFTIEINNIGCKKCQPKIRKKIQEALKSKEKNLCPACQERIKTNPLRVLDCKEEKCKEVVKNAPHIIDLICSDCKKHFTSVLEYLDEAKVAYDLNPYLVRGFDYYTSTTFEVKDKKDPIKLASLGGGGRYDGLLKKYSQTDIPAIGFAGGIERIADKMKELEINPSENKTIQVYIAHLGAKGKKQAFRILAELIDKGYNAQMSLGNNSLGAQLKNAGKLQSKLTFIIGQREIIDKTIIVKDMEEAIQETIDIEEVMPYVDRKFQK